MPEGGSYADLIEALRPEAMSGGEIVDGHGRVHGRHQGIARYTIGQSRRLGEAALIDGQRQQVVGVEPVTRRIVVAPRAASGRRTLRLREMNWLVPPPAEGETLRCTVQLRAREDTRLAMVRTGSGDTLGEAEVLLDDSAHAAPGQACVLYDGARVLGGGFICRP